MGTSVSFRSPNTPRWRAVLTAYETADSLERIRSELFNAGEGWSTELASRSLTPYLLALTAAFHDLPAAVQRADRPEIVVRDIVRRARVETLAEGAAPTLAVAERALQHTLVSGLRGDKPLSETSGTEAAAAWQANRGRDPTRLVQRFLGEVLRQFTLHAVSRDAAHLLRSRRADDAAALREVTRALGETAARVAEDVRISVRGLREAPADAWAAAVRDAFTAGRRLPRAP